VLFWAVLFLAGCGNNNGSTGPEYSASPKAGSEQSYYLAVHPLYNPAKLHQAYQPLVDYLNSHVKGFSFTLQASRDYADFEKKYLERKIEFILPNPFQTLQAMKTGYHVIATAGDPADFKGIFVVRKDSGIKRPVDLKGKAVSYPSPTALAACIMPQYFLFLNGVDVNRDIVNQYVGSQESSIMNVFLGKTAAGATWPPPWRFFRKEYPQQAAELRVIWETDSLISNALMARDDMPVAVVEQLRRLLVGLDKTPAGKAILAKMETARFISAVDQDYALVRDYLSRFERSVRKVDLQ